MKQRTLELLKPNEFVSGEAIASELDISRTAVWKHIRSLKQLGYDIETVKNRGYRLISSPDLLLAEEVGRDLDTKIIGNEIEYHSRIGSTNTRGKELARKKVQEGMVIVAEEQTEGRGRKQRQWSSPEGGLWFSVILYPDLPPDKGMLVTMMTSISVAKGIEETTGITPLIKWPNDLLLDGKKICGILTELDAELDRIESLVVGIGINVNNRIDIELKDIAMNLETNLGKPVSRVDLLRSILRSMDSYYELLKRGDHDRIRDKWTELSRMVGRKISVVGERDRSEGTVLRIDDSGCIILETKTGQKRIVSGDIRYLDRT